MSAREGLVHGMPEREYHNGPELSSTGARQILDSPARFKWEQDHPRTSEAFDVGTAAHSLLLGVGAGLVLYPDEHLTPSGNVSTKAATLAWAAEERAKGHVPVSPDEHAAVYAMAEAVLAHPLARRTLEDTEREVSVFATDPETGVRTRARFDALSETVAADIKTTRASASPAGFGRAAAAYGYPIQQAWYLDALRWATDAMPPFLFIVVEKKPPYLVAVHELPELAVMYARDLAAQARRTYAECLAAGKWPGYGADVIETELPAWWWHQVDADEEMEISA